MRTQWVRRFGIAATITTWLYLVTREILPAVGKVTEGFAAYYTAAYAILHGGAADLNNNALFAVWLPRAGVTVREVYQGNTPTLGLLMIPLTPFSPAIAQTLWLIINVILLIVGSWLAGRMVAPENVAARWWIAAVFVMLAPVRETLRFGQVYLLMALLFLLTVRWLMKRDGAIGGSGAGIGVAVIGLLKAYYGTLTLIPLIWARRYFSLREILPIVLTVSLVVIASLPLIGSAWAGYFSVQLAADSLASASIPANQTLHSLFSHLFTYNAQWNPNPLVDVAGLAIVLRYSTLIVLVVVTFVRGLRRDKVWIWLPALILMPALAPVGEPHHYTILLLPIAVAVTRLINFIDYASINTAHRADSVVGVDPFGVNAVNQTQAIIMIIGLILLITPYPSLRDASLWQSWLGLLAYPRLIGALLLWAAL